MNAGKLNPRIIAITGKGGVGKTSISYFLAQELMNRHMHPLLIDADPTTSHLTRELGISPPTTIEQLRKDLIGVAARGDPGEKALVARELDNIVAKCIIQGDQFDLLVMGQPQLAGCFCPSNTLLREIIEKIAGGYKKVLIDCEAGMEQIHRQVIRQVDFVLIIAENTRGSFETAMKILQAAKKFTTGAQMGFILNKVQGAHELILPLPEELTFLGTIPEDAGLKDLEVRGLPPKSLPSNAPLRQAIRALSTKFFDTGM